MEAAIVPAGLCIITLPVSKIPLIARKAGWRFRNAANLDRIPYVKTARGCARDDRELARERYLSIARHPHSSASMERPNCSVSRPRLFSAFSFSFFFFCWFSFLILLREILEKFFEFFGDFSFFLFLFFFYWICRTSFISLSSLTGILENFFEFFLFFVELDLFDRRFSFSRWLFLIRIVDNFFEFFFFFVRFLELRNLFFCRWFSYPSVNYSFFIEVFEIIFELLTIFLFEILIFFESLCSFPYRFYSIYLEFFEKTSLSPLFTDFSLLLFRLLLKLLAMDLCSLYLVKGTKFCIENRKSVWLRGGAKK